MRRWWLCFYFQLNFNQVEEPAMPQEFPSGDMDIPGVSGSSASGLIPIILHCNDRAGQ